MSIVFKKIENENIFTRDFSRLVAIAKFTENLSQVYKQISSLVIKNQIIFKQRDLLPPHLMREKLEV